MSGNTETARASNSCTAARCVTTRHKANARCSTRVFPAISSGIPTLRHLYWAGTTACAGYPLRTRVETAVRAHFGTTRLHRLVRSPVPLVGGALFCRRVAPGGARPEYVNPVAQRCRLRTARSQRPRRVRQRVATRMSHFPRMPIPASSPFSFCSRPRAASEPSSKPAMSMGTTPPMPFRLQ